MHSFTPPAFKSVRTAILARRLSSTFRSAASFSSSTNVVRVGGIPLPVNERPERPDLVPKGLVTQWGDDIHSKEVVSHMRWMAQKITMKQDMFLLGSPSPFRRRIVLTLAELCGWEVEYLMITKDTTESDLKQRREIVGNSVLFTDQAPVRAARHGRLLILDGIENAERNVLPTLNNLLENREMALEDGHFMMPGARIQSLAAEVAGNERLLRVNDAFRVVALGLPIPPYPGRTLDPPLRSRFQSRFVDEPSLEDAFASVNAGGVSRENLQAVGSFYQGLQHLRSESIAEVVGANLSMIPTFSLDNLDYCFHLLRNDESLAVKDAISRAIPLGYSLKHSFSARGSPLTGTSLPVQVTKLLDDAIGIHRSTAAIGEAPSLSGNWHSHYQSELLPGIVEDLKAGRHVCVLGPKGSGKSYMLPEVGARLAASGSGSYHGTIRIFPLFQELTARDLLQRRCTVAESDETTTSWQDSPLVTAARNGDLCVLDGIDRIDPHSLFILRRLVQDGEIELPNGEKLRQRRGSESANTIHPDFRIIALGLPPLRADDARARYIMSDLGMTYHFLHANNNAKDISKVMEHAAGGTDLTVLEQYFVVLVGILHDVAFENAELHVSLRHALRCQSILRQMASEEDGVKANPGVVVDVLAEMLLVRFLPSEVSAKFYSAVSSFRSKLKYQKQRTEDKAAVTNIHVDPSDRSGAHGTGSLTIGNVKVSRRATPAFPELVPDPLYFDNPAQTLSLESILRSISTGERAMLLIGNQGVGKNKLIDRLLHLWHAEREYVQVHRDTTIQSLTLLPLLEGGKIVYEDSPLVRAVETGRVLLLDEVDKAPLEVVCVLKGLVGDGELLLHSGRRILSMKRAMYEWRRADPSSTEVGDDEKTIFASTAFQNFCQRQGDILPIHPDFRLFCLANRPGHPFLGNQFYKECGDLFVCHVIENLDVISEVNLLQAFAPDVDTNTLFRLANVFSDLRALNESGTLAYPFSAREAVAVAKHLQSYPDDSMELAAENILGFDGMSPKLREIAAGVFRDNGFDVPVKREELFLRGLKHEKEGRVIGGRGRYQGEDGRSTPRTGVNMPKHGKIDPKNKPHVGGNTWAGGTGGSDTAGLGGRGGPYRLDAGHKVHQMSDEDKAQVSDESRARAAEMAKRAFEERLEEIKMGKQDFQRYNYYSNNVKAQVQQLKDLLDEVCRRGKERVWVRNQIGGELDDGKLVDGLSGERNVFKKRGYDPTGMTDGASTSDEPVRTKIQFVVDVSGSMVRFNGYDGRLERMLETTLMIMQSLPRPDPNGESEASLANVVEYSIVGHSGDTSQVTFVEFPSLQEQGMEGIGDATNPHSSFLNVGKYACPMGPLNEKDMLQILERMVAHSQYCFSGDNTLPATEKAIQRIAQIEAADENVERLVIVVSDANFDRYGIEAWEVSEAMRTSDRVQTHMVMIGGLGDEAQDVVAELPVGKGHTCMDSADLPSILRQILTASLGV